MTGPALWTSDEAAAATGGASAKSWVATGVSIDTRTLQPGDLFVALSDQRDGHDFVADALEKGAAAALVSRVPEGVAEDAPLLLVKNVLKALEKMGAAARARTGAKVIAVTGSVGKTTTKEMLRVMLAPQGRVHAAEASFNNHWGVPLTLARMPAETEFAVIEIGMNHPGEIAPLARLAQPDAAIVTTVAAAHLAAFDDIEGIAVEKASIFSGLVLGGTAVLNMDLPTTGILQATAAAVGARISGFGRHEDAGLQLLSVHPGAEATVFEAAGPDGTFTAKLSTGGAHFVTNALAALAAVRAVGGDGALAVCDLASWKPGGGRGLCERIVLDPVEGLGFDLIDDAYNANPTSVTAALELLAVTPPTHGVGRIARGRRIAVLGDMLELGETEAQLHAALATLPAIETVDLVHCVGPRMAHLWAALPEEKRGRQVVEVAGLLGQAHELVDAGDVVLVKGSKGIQVARLVDGLRALGHAPSDA